MSSARSTAFTSEEYDNAYPEGIERHYWTLARNQIIEQMVRRAPGSDGLILDIGCGRGISVEYLRGHGLNCLGTELADVVIPTHLRPYCSSASDAFAIEKNLRNSVTTILLLDVLEHLDDPGQFLDRCVAAFPALKSIVVTVPARKELWSNFDDYYGHKTRYDLATLRQLGVRDGLRLAEMGYFFHALYLPMRIMSTFFRRRAVHFSPPSTNFGLAHRLLARGLVADSQLLPSTWYGTSIGAVLTRSA